MMGWRCGTNTQRLRTQDSSQHWTVALWALGTVKFYTDAGAAPGGVFRK